MAQTPYIMRNCVLLLVASALVACAPNFKSFKSVPPSGVGFTQHRVNATGNAVVEMELPPIDTVKFERKLNGGLGGQVVGNSQFIIVPSYNKRIYFLDPRTGNEITSMEAGSSVGSAVALKDELIYFANESGSDQLTAMNLVNGKKLWSLKIIDPPAAPIVDGDDLFITSRIGKVYRMNRFTGKIEWEQELLAHMYAPPAVDSKAVYVGTDRGAIVALDRATGSENWRVETGSTIFAQPLAAKFLYVGVGDGTFLALDKETGTEVWRHQSTNSIHTTAVLKDNRIVFGADDRTVYCLNAEDGGIIWRYETDGVVQASPIAVGNSFIVANSAGSVYHFARDGALEGRVNVGGTVIAPPAVIDGLVYVVTTQRRLYAIGS